MTAGVDRVTVESADETRIHVSVFPSVKPVAALVVVHGLQSHAGWLEASGTGHHLAEKGIVTFAFDRRGSGRSAGQRGHAARRGEFLEDLEAVRELVGRELVGRRHPDAPVHLLANCFGTRVALPFLAEKPQSFDSVVLTSPATHMSRRCDYGLLERLRILTAPPERRFPTPLGDRDFVSGGVWLDWIRDDHRSLRACTASFLRAAARLTDEMHQAVGTLRHPLMILTAEDDVMVRNEAIERYFRRRYRGPLRLRRLPGEHYMDFTHAQGSFRSALTGWFLGGWAAP
jgi:alpha-beta hydrolase superfamily lysophospholipase